MNCKTPNSCPPRPSFSPQTTPGTQQPRGSTMLLSGALQRARPRELRGSRRSMRTTSPESDPAPDRRLTGASGGSHSQRRLRHIEQNLIWRLTCYDVQVPFPWKRALFSRFLDQSLAFHLKQEAVGPLHTRLQRRFRIWPRSWETPRAGTEVSRRPAPLVHRANQGRLPCSTAPLSQSSPRRFLWAWTPPHLPLSHTRGAQLLNSL